MADYKHGTYGQVLAVGTKAAQASSTAMVYVGSAPVHHVLGGCSNLNKPVLVENIAQARAKFGYSEDWADFTLCEAMHVHFELNSVGPLVMINVYDPTTRKSSATTTKNVKMSGGKLVLADADDVIVDTLTVKAPDGEAVAVAESGFSVSYDYERKTLTLSGAANPAGDSTDAYVLTYSTLDADSKAPTQAELIGESDLTVGKNTGLYAIRTVYQVTGYIPGFLVVPGWSSVPAVHSVMVSLSKKLNDHWDIYLYVDLPLVNGETKLTLGTVATYKEGNGYNQENESVYWPMAAGTDGNYYHLSVLAAANLQALLLDQDGIPYRSASNTDCAIIEGLHTGDDVDPIYDDYTINYYLNKNGIDSAAYVGGRWAIWGAHSADYNQSNADSINVAETNRMMLYYLSNDFQHRRWPDVDQPMTTNTLATIVAEEQARLDALVKIGALLYGEVSQNATADARSDMLNGDFSFVFNVTTTPLAKSLTAVVQWTDEGFSTYFAEEE